jgi:SAM-dependent methyltransferase
MGYFGVRNAEIGRLRGTVLEIGAGRGRNFDLFAPGVTWIGAEPDPGFRARLAERARQHGHREPPRPDEAESLSLGDASVDGVLSTVVLCSVRDVDAALAEIVRVLRPGGTFVFAEHVGAAPGSWKRRAQRAYAPLSRRFDHGCDPTGDTEAALRRSGLRIVRLEHHEVPALPGLTMPYIVGGAEK